MWTDPVHSEKSVNTYIYTYTQRFPHMYTYNIPVYMQHIPMSAYIYTYIRIRIYVYIHIYVYTYTRILIPAPVYIHTRKHVHVCSSNKVPGSYKHLTLTTTLRVSTCVVAV